MRVRNGAAFFERIVSGEREHVRFMSFKFSPASADSVPWTPSRRRVVDAVARFFTVH
jgi:hypothetical protein